MVTRYDARKIPWVGGPGDSNRGPHPWKGETHPSELAPWVVDYHLDVSTEDIISWTLDPSGTIQFGFPKLSGDMLLLFGWPSRTDWLLRTSFSSGVSPTLCPVYFAGLVFQTGTTCFSVANSLLVFG